MTLKGKDKTMDAMEKVRRAAMMQVMAEKVVLVTSTTVIKDHDQPIEESSFGLIVLGG